MQHFTVRSLLILFACFSFATAGQSQLLQQQQPDPPPASAQQERPKTPQRDPAKEALVLQELQKIAPKAVETFKTATQDLDTQNYVKAIPGFNETLRQAPNFEPALRRLGYCLIATGKRKEGLELTQKALSQNRTADNLIGHASSLITPGADNYEAPPTELKQALALMKEGFEKSGKTDKDAALLIAQLNLSTNNAQGFDESVVLLKEKFPDEMATHYFNAIRLANYGAFSAAKDEIMAAEKLGLPREDSQRMLLAISEAADAEWYDPWSYLRVQNLFYTLSLFGIWGLGLLLLYVIGEVLSAKTLRSIEASDPNDITGGGQAGLRKIYRAVITFAGIYYYISQPIVVLLVVAVTIGAALFFLSIGIIPVKLLFIFGLVGLITIFYMIRSVFVRTKVEDPGRALGEEEAPGLWALAREVAETVNTRPVNEIRITPGTDLAVYERGGMWAKMTDNAERILILGTAVLNDFRQNSFRAVLAHEYGHFSNRDTAGGNIAMRVNNHIINLAMAMGQSGTATFYNIAFQFLRLYHFLFRRITHGATRLQEILADRVAAYQYGTEAFRDGLTHVIRREVEFNYLANKEINSVLSDKRAMQNLYELSEQDENAIKNMSDEMNTIITRPTTDDDTHPSPQDRFKLISQIKSKETTPIEGMVWDLFKDKDALTGEMNKMLENAVKASM